MFLVRSLCVGLAVFALTLVTAVSSHSQNGTRPRNLVSRSNGTVLITSMGSHALTQVSWDGSDFQDPVYIATGGESWGVCLVDDQTAVVTLPLAGKLLRLEWNHAVGRWEIAKTMDAPYYCTEVIVSGTVGGRSVFVANRGAAPANGEEWQHAVYEIDVDTGAIVRTFVTDREPRALAISPDGTRLFVGHAQGALGGKAVDATTGTSIGDHPLSNPIYDGGSVIAFALENGSARPVYRFAVGSPVRGIAVLLVEDERYRVFFSHVGYGAAGEDPQFWGRDIANTITSIGFDASTNTPLGTDTSNPTHRQDFVLDHDPDAQNRLAILHEKLMMRARGSRKELWVTNSGAGTASRVRLRADGLAVTDGDITIRFPRVLPGVPRADGGWLLDENITATMAAFETVSIGRVNTDSVSHFNVGDVASNPRGIVYDDSRDRVLVNGHLSHELYAIEASFASPTIVDLRVDGEPDPVSTDERNFFTFERGFSFRDFGVAPGSELKTNNLTCGTCHVDGHIDGKIRFTVRAIENLPQSNPSGSINVLGDIGKPVHVSTVFDMGGTEWMFFEGLKTIRDGVDPREPHLTEPPDERCGYCLFQIAGFFFDTDVFTRDLQTPMSPHAPTGTLSDSQNEGRLLFEAMNCSRCHMGATRVKFPRTQEAAKNLPLNDDDFTGNGQFGPAPVGLQTENRLLHDPTQLVFKNDLRVCPQGTISNEVMNMTDVGTRNADDGSFNGINTPALAGVWDNRPYMHDGRYRTLVDVLANTYLDVDDGHRAAPLEYDGTPDNAKGGTFPDDPCQMTMSNELFIFDTHKQYASAPPAGLVSVLDYLKSLGKLDVFVDFLNAVSSQTDLCTGSDNIPDALDVPTVADSMSVFTWTTRVPVQCRVVWGPSSGALSNELITPLATEHNVELQTNVVDEYRIQVTAFTRGLCFEQPMVEAVWDVDESNIVPVVAGNSLSQNVPNPFNPETRISYSIKADMHVDLAIYDVSGKRVTTLVNGMQKTNTYEVVWDGTNGAGGPVATGVYFYRLRTPSFTRTRKMVLLK